MWPFSKKKKGDAMSDNAKEKDDTPKPERDHLNDTHILCLELAESLDELKKAKADIHQKQETARLKASHICRKAVK